MAVSITQQTWVYYGANYGICSTEVDIGSYLERWGFAVEAIVSLIDVFIEAGSGQAGDAHFHSLIRVINLRFTSYSYLFVVGMTK